MFCSNFDFNQTLKLNIQSYFTKIENIRNKINNEICVIIDNIYAIQYIELLAIQKSVFEIENFARNDHIVKRRAVKYCLKQANFRNLIV